MLAERRNLAAHNVEINMEGRGEMTKIPVNLQDLRRRLYIKAKAEPSWRFWGLYVHVCKRETLHEAYRLTKANDGAPGIDGVTFEAIEAEGVEGFLEQLHQELVERRYQPERLRKVEIPKDGGKVRQLSIPSIRDRVVQGALKLILDPVMSKNPSVCLAGQQGLRRVLGCADASLSESIFVSCRFPCGLAEPATAPNHSLSGRGKLRSAAADRPSTAPLYG